MISLLQAPCPYRPFTEPHELPLGEFRPVDAVIEGARLLGHVVMHDGFDLLCECGAQIGEADFAACTSERLVGVPHREHRLDALLAGLVDSGELRADAVPVVRRLIDYWRGTFGELVAAAEAVAA